MARAFADLHQVARLDGVSMAGRTDRWIFTELARRHGVSAGRTALARLRRTYLAHLSHEIEQPAAGKRELPGVRALLDRLSGRDDLCLALLTGNLAEGARIKLEHFDLWRYFQAGGYGDRALHRTAVFEDALAAVARVHGRQFRPEDTIVIGDTPLDVEVAVTTGARSLAVATGSFGADALRAAGADVVLPDLGDLGRVLDAMGLSEG